MANPFYTATPSTPPSQQRALSAAIRNEFTQIQTGFDAVKTAINTFANSNLNASLPSQTANQGKALISDGTNTLWGQSLYFDEANLRIGVGTSNPTARLTVSDNSAPLPAALAGTEVHVAAANGVSTRVLLDSFAVPSGVSVRRANNTPTAPGSLQSNNEIGYFGVYGFGATSYSTSDRGSIGWYASQNWTDSAQGTYCVISVTANGSVVPTAAITVGNDGSVAIAGSVLTLNGAQVETQAHAASTYSTIAATSAAASAAAAAQSTANAALPKVNPSSSGTFTHTSGNFTVASGDIYAYRAGGATGVIFLNQAGNKYLYFDGTNYNLPGGDLNLNGQFVNSAIASVLGTANAAQGTANNAFNNANTALNTFASYLPNLQQSNVNQRGYIYGWATTSVVTLPAGGTWFYYHMQFNGSGQALAGAGALVAGGTVAFGGGGTSFGWAIKVS